VAPRLASRDLFVNRLERSRVVVIRAGGVGLNAQLGGALFEHEFNLLGPLVRLEGV